MILLCRILCCVVFFILSGCTTYNQVISNHHKVSQCKKICVQHFNSCKKNCVDNCPNCSINASYTSATNFTKYVHEKQVQGGIVTRGLKSYRDPLQCHKVSCNCPSDFITCNQGCTGVIQKTLRSVPYCT